MKYAKVTMEQALQRPILMKVLIGNGVSMAANYYLVPEDHTDISFILLNLEPWGDVEWVTLKGKQAAGVLSME